MQINTSENCDGCFRNYKLKLYSPKTIAKKCHSCHSKKIKKIVIIAFMYLLLTVVTFSLFFI